MNRAAIISTKTLKSEEATNSFDYYLDITHEMQPSIIVLASYVRSDGEIVADYSTITVSLKLQNKVIFIVVILISFQFF